MVMHMLEVLMKMEGFKKDNSMIVLTMWQSGFEQAHKSCNKKLKKTKLRKKKTSRNISF
jgi:hypothetical protein